MDEVAGRYCVGIDLGTTNCAVSYIDTREPETPIHTFMIPQWIAPGEIEARATLPSFHYEPAQGECAPEQLWLPWSTAPESGAVGVWARDRGALAPGRQIASAKSWLCHNGIDRTAPNLPWHGATDVTRLSPVQATTRILRHLRHAWNHAFAEYPMEAQHLAITVPASFDEVARELTVAAAHDAGLAHFVLLEEPQAAFYAWLQRHETDWRDHINAGQVILVCDIGGGTTDFTLISCEGEETADLSFRRISVGRHLLLGGDNLDLAMAHHIEEALRAQQTLSIPQWSELIRRCRTAKEQALSEHPPENITLSIKGTGRALIGDSVQYTLPKEQAEALLLDGFFPRCAPDDQPAVRASGFREFGLPYAADAAITRYLAAFLSQHTDANGARMPDYILFNGGVLASPAIRQRLLDVLASWFDGHPPRLLENGRLDLAVSRGAAYFGQVRRGEGVRVQSGLSHAYYIGIASDTNDAKAPTAICLAPRGMQEAESILLDQTFLLRVRQPVEFPFYASSLRTRDVPGDHLPLNEEAFTPLPPIRTVLKTGKKKQGESLPVRLRVDLTDIGILEVRAEEVDGSRQWRLPLDVRATVAAGERAPRMEAMGGLEDSSSTQAVRECVAQVFSRDHVARKAPREVTRLIEEITQTPRSDWSLPLLRGIWDAVRAFPDARQMSAGHEARWLNLLGYSLRPGFGFPVDDWRVEQTWRLHQQALEHKRSEPCRAEWWILWRRIAGGLTKGQQQSLAAPLIAAMQRTNAGKQGPTKCLAQTLKTGPHEIAEIWRLLGSLEHLAPATRQQLGDWIIQDLGSEGIQAAQGAALWALGRIAERSPAYTSLCNVLPAETVETWVRQLMALPGWQKEHLFSLALMTRRTGDRYRDIDESLRNELLDWLERQDASPRTIQLIATEQRLDREEQAKSLGDQLPIGLSLKT